MNLSAKKDDISFVVPNPLRRSSLKRLLAAGLGGSLLLVPGVGTAATPSNEAPSPVVVLGTDAAHTAAAVGRAGGSVDRILDSVGGVSAQLTADQRRALEGAGLRVVADSTASVTSTGFDDAGDLVQVAALNPLAADDAAAGAGVGVALLDTGVAAVAGIADRMAEVVDLTDEADGIDRYGHGTFMAGLIAGQGTGAAPGAHLVSVKIAGADGTTSLSTVLDGVDFVVETRDEFDTRILSLSLGVEAMGPWAADPLAIAAEYASAAGILVVTAAGNEAGRVTSPGIAPSALTVGATDHHDTATTNDDTVAAWSGSAATKPEVVAPGEAIVSLRAPGSTIEALHPSARIGDDQFRGSGTSMATALAAGAAAVVAEQTPDATPRELKAMLVVGAEDLGTGVRTVDIQGAEQLAASLQLNRPAGPVVDGGRPVSWTGSSWSGTRWTGTRWTGTRWTGTRWTGTRWTGTRWTGNSWTGTRWAGTRWTGTRWTGTRWTGTRWTGTRWTGTRWAASHFGG